MSPSQQPSAQPATGPRETPTNDKPSSETHGNWPGRDGGQSTLSSPTSERKRRKRCTPWASWEKQDSEESGTD